MSIVRSSLILLASLFMASDAVATLIGDEINVTAVRNGSAGDTTILDGASATVSATEVEFSVPNFQGGGSLFSIDFTENAFTIFVDLADFSFLEPYSILLSDLDWVDQPGQLESVTQTVFETDGNGAGWLNNIAFGADFINLTSDAAFFSAGVTFTTTYEFTASHDGVVVPEPGTFGLLGIGLLGLLLGRRKD